MIFKTYIDTTEKSYLLRPNIHEKLPKHMTLLAAALWWLHLNAMVMEEAGSFFYVPYALLVIQTVQNDQGDLHILVQPLKGCTLLLYS